MLHLYAKYRRTSQQGRAYSKLLTSLFCKIKKSLSLRARGEGEVGGGGVCGGVGAVSYKGSDLGDTVQISEHFEIEQ